MQTLKGWKTHNIHGSSLVAGVNEIIAAVQRLFQAWQIQRTTSNLQSDKTLCYRGTRVSPVDSNMGSNRQSQRIDEELCYRGTRNLSAFSAHATKHEVRRELVNENLCYRGSRYTEQHSVTA